nr:D-alanyl-D-alanine carboxypeptidase family protein [Clostridioides mangenotii]
MKILKNSIKKILSVIILMAIITPNAVYADQKNIDMFSKASIIIDQDSGRVLYEKNADEKLPLASLTKMMTFLLAIEAIEKGEVKNGDVITIDKDAASIKGSTYKLKAGEKIPLIELMRGLMIVSGNDAAAAIAKHISNTQGNFVDRMNKKANELGMTNTHFLNVNGLPIYDLKNPKAPAKENKSSARDIAILGKYMFDKYEKQVTAITDMETYTYKERNFEKSNTNALLRMIPEVDGIKTGYTGNAGYCLSFSMLVNKDQNNDKNRRVIGVTLGANHKNKRISAATAMLKYGKENVKVKKVIDKNTVIGKKYIKGIKDLEVVMKTKGEFYAVTKDDETLKSSVDFKELEYPVKKGDKLGIIKYTNTSGELIGSVDIISANDVKNISFIDRIKIKLAE